MQNDTIRHALRHSCHLPGLRHHCHPPGLRHTHLGYGVLLVPSSCFRPSPGTPSYPGVNRKEQCRRKRKCV